MSQCAWPGLGHRPPKQRSSRLRQRTAYRRLPRKSTNGKDCSLEGVHEASASSDASLAVGAIRKGSTKCGIYSVTSIRLTFFHGRSSMKAQIVRPEHSALRLMIPDHRLFELGFAPDTERATPTAEFKDSWVENRPGRRRCIGPHRSDGNGWPRRSGPGEGFALLPRSEGRRSKKWRNPRP
jgi:hypothetical protein